MLSVQTGSRGQTDRPFITVSRVTPNNQSDLRSQYLQMLTRNVYETYHASS